MLGIHELLVNSITRADLDLRKTLYSQIVLSGGSTFFSGFGDRLLNEVRKMAPKDTKVSISILLSIFQNFRLLFRQIRISAPSERKTLTWAGTTSFSLEHNFKLRFVFRYRWLDPCFPCNFQEDVDFKTGDTARSICFVLVSAVISGIRRRRCCHLE